MTESEAIEKLKQHFEYLKHAWKPHPDYETMDAIGYAIQALEKQIAKKPIEYEDKFYACPVCKNPVMHKWKKYNTELMEKSNGLPVCLNCLQAIDWSDEE